MEIMSKIMRFVSAKRQNWTLFPKTGRLLFIIRENVMWIFFKKEMFAVCYYRLNNEKTVGFAIAFKEALLPLFFEMRFTMDKTGKIQKGKHGWNTPALLKI